MDREKQLDDDAFTTSSCSVNDPRNVVKFYLDLSQSFHTVSGLCSSVIPQYQSSDMQAVCADFDASSWTGFNSLLDGACDMPGAPSAAGAAASVLPAKMNPLRGSALVQSLCAHRIAAAEADIPGGLSSDGAEDSLMGFMKWKEKEPSRSLKSAGPVSGSVGGSVLVVLADFSLGS